MKSSFPNSRLLSGDDTSPKKQIRYGESRDERIAKSTQKKIIMGLDVHKLRFLIVMHNSDISNIILFCLNTTLKCE
jgi:hypothetical protein